MIRAQRRQLEDLQAHERRSAQLANLEGNGAKVCFHEHHVGRLERQLADLPLW